MMVPSNILVLDNYTIASREMAECNSKHQRRTTCSQYTVHNQQVRQSMKQTAKQEINPHERIHAQNEIRPGDDRHC